MAELDFSRMFSGGSPALANLGPVPVVNLTQGGNFQFQPLSAVQAISAHPEQIGLGAIQGAESLVKGITAAQEQKKKDALDEEERKRKADLDERQMALGENKFQFEKGKLNKEYEERLSAAGADKGPPVTPASMPVSQPQAAPVTETEPPVDQNEQPLNYLQNKQAQQGVLSGIGTVDPFKYHRDVSPTVKQGAELNKPNNVKVVAPVLSSVPPVQQGNIFAPAGPESGVRNPLADLKMAYDAISGKVKRFSELEETSKNKYTTGTQSGGSVEGVPSTFSNLRETLFPSQKSSGQERVAEKTTPTGKPQASYQYPESQWEQLQRATSSDKVLSPSFTASADTGDRSTDEVKPLSPTLQVPAQAGFSVPNAPKLFNLDLSQMPKTNAPTDKVPTAQAQQPQTRFTIPERPKADQIPKDVSTRDYEQARQEQAKDYGFYYEPLGKIETHKDANGLWYKVVRDPEKAAIIEQKLGRLEVARQRYDKYQLQEQNTIDREQTKFFSSPDVKAFTAPSGMRQSFARFVKDYDAILKNPEASGISDVGLLDMFGRAEGGGKITEGQAALALRAIGIMDKPEMFMQKLQGGARLSPNQRDQMLRVISEDHAAQANLANQQIEMVRTKLAHQGITDETMLPQPYIIPVTKWEFAEKTKEARALSTQLHLQKAQAEKAGDTNTVDQINQQLSDLQKQIDPLYDMAKRSKGSAIINSYDIEHTPQGWAGGAVATFQQQEP